MFLWPAGRPIPAPIHNDLAGDGAEVTVHAMQCARRTRSAASCPRIPHAKSSLTHTDAGEVLAVAQHRDDAAHAVVAAVAALGTQPRLCRRQVQVVVDHQHMVLLDLQQGVGPGHGGPTWISSAPPQLADRESGKRGESVHTACSREDSSQHETACNGVPCSSP